MVQFQPQLQFYMGRFILVLRLQILKKSDLHFLGLSDSDLDELARLGHQAIKTSRRDLAYVISQKKTGATTYEF